MPLLDTRTKADTLVGKFISDIVLQVLSFVAENERANIKVRQAEGIRIAKQNGTHFGRPKFEYSQEFLEVTNEYFAKRIKAGEAMKKLGLKRPNFYYHINKLKSNINFN